MTPGRLRFQAVLFIIRVEIQEYYSFICASPAMRLALAPFCEGGATIRHDLERGCSLRVEIRPAACQGFSLITGHIAPDAASGACGGRTIRPSEWANIFIMDESCFP